MRGPAGEGEAVDLGVVADVHGKFRPEIKERDPGGGGIAQGELAKLPDEAGGIPPEGGFRDQGRALAPAFPDADQGAAPGPGMDAKNLLADFRVGCAGLGFDPLGFPPAKPNASVGTDMAAVAHPMPDGSA